MKRTISSLLALLTVLLQLVSCASGTGDESSSKPDDSPTANPQPEAAIETEPETEANKFEGMDFAGEEMRIQTSINADDSTNANALIEGAGEETGDVANDAVYKRNLDVEEMLNVKLSYIESNYTYSTAQAATQKIILAGDDTYDLIIQDLMCMAALAVDGLFLDVSKEPILDFERSYWWGDYMADLSLGNDTAMYILAGDYFMDVLCSAHCLYFNKQRLTDLTGDGDSLYHTVLEGNWTCDEFLKTIEMAYQDLNGNGESDLGDNFGYTSFGMWGSGIPFYVCGDLTFVTRDENGVPSFALDKDPRAVTTLEMLNKIYYNNASYPGFTDYIPL